MGYMSKEEYDKQLQIVQNQNLDKLRRRKLRIEKNKYNFRIKVPSTSKLVLLGVFLICIEIIVFAEYAMIVLGDASAMYALIGVPAALIPVCLGYYSKSKAENTTGGITYESAIAQIGLKQDIEQSDNEETVG